MSSPVRYAISGLGHRAWTTYLPLFADAARRGAELVAVVDADPARLTEFVARWPSRVPVYLADDFSRMLAEVAPDWAILSSPDHAHHAQILEALAMGVSVISEKPLVISALQAREVLAAARRSRGRILVAHNLRYQNLSTRIKALLADGRLGTVRSVKFDYHLTAGHAGSYFLRWHRRRAASGGLPITKSCHHFDLLTWWMDDVPVEVSGRTARLHFRPDAPFPDDESRIVPPEADIEDTIRARIRYRGGGKVSYSLTSCSPWEGYALAILGSRGSLTARYDKLSTDDHFITVRLGRGSERRLRVPRESGRHSGADSRMADAVFGRGDAREPGGLPGAHEAAVSVAIGDAIHRSNALGVPVVLSDLLPLRALVAHEAVRGRDALLAPAGVGT